MIKTNILIRFLILISCCLSLHTSSSCLQEESHSAVQHVIRSSMIKPCKDSGKPFQERFHGHP